MCYDSTRQVSVTMGGFSGEDDTWEWDGNDWTKKAGSTMTYDLSAKADAIWHYTTISIPSGVTLSFTRNVANTPVVWLASENVQIDGILNLNGQAASAVGTSGRTSNPAKGGPGGYDGGEGGIASSVPGLAGSGPGGGAGGATTSAAGANATHVGTYGSAFAIPLIGGSGGGGGARGASADGGKGGGGGGAILIASTKDITLTGSILAQGGAGGTAGSAGGAGSGGTVRLVGDRVLATSGIINTNAGGASTNSGRVRLEGFVRQSTPANLTGNVSQSVPVEGSALSQAGARLFIDTVAGQNIASQPTGNTVNPDVIFSQAGNITITVHAQNIPDGTPVTVTINHSTAGVINLPASGSVTLQACAATFTTTVPAGQGTIQAFATYTVGGTPTP